jgi:hypothetical protein
MDDVRRGERWELGDQQIWQELTGTRTTARITTTLVKIVALSKKQLTVVGIAIAALTASLIIENGWEKSLHRQNKTLQQKIAQLTADNQSLADKIAKRSVAVPRLPTPAIPVSNSSAADLDVLPSANLYNRLIDKDLKLKPEQIEAYLRSSGRSAASLLAAYRTTSEPAVSLRAKPARDLRVRIGHF